MNRNSLGFSHQTKLISSAAIHTLSRLSPSAKFISRAAISHPHLSVPLPPSAVFDVPSSIVLVSFLHSSSSSPSWGSWVKLISGASFEDVIDIRNLSLVYTLSGVDCIDCAAEALVVNAVNDGIEAAQDIYPIRRQWVMISVNDSEDLHFRKAEFDPGDCPPDCSKPCENVCPAGAISYSGKAGIFKVQLCTYVMLLLQLTYLSRMKLML